jgi:hypothetical protein
MYLGNKTKQPAVEPEQTAPPITKQGGMEFYGSPVVPSGVTLPEEMPDEISRILASIDVTALPVNKTVKDVLKEMHERALLRVNSTAKDPNELLSSVKKVNSINDLSAEDRKRLSDFIAAAANEKPQEKTPEIISESLKGIKPSTNETVGFSTPQELFKHVHEKTQEYLVNKSVSDIKTTDEESGSVTGDSGEQPAKNVSADIPQGMTHCPNCNCLLTFDPVEVSKENRKAFLLSVISGKPYTETTSVFGGAVSVTFRALSSDEKDAMSMIMHHATRMTEISPSTAYTLIDRFLFVLVLQSVVIDGKERHFNRLDVADKPAEEILPVFNERFNEVSSVILSGELLQWLVQHASLFSLRCRRLAVLSDVADFWKPIQE